LGKFQSEINQRAFYQRWAEMMDDPSVPAVPDMSRRDACKVSS
jgi:hypothetical protein